MEYPKELALGNIVKLKKPYKPQLFTEHERKQRQQIMSLLRAKQSDPHPLAKEQMAMWDGWAGFSYGIIVEHIGRNAMGEFNVSLQLYDPELGVIFMGPNNIPEYVDCSSSEFTLWKIATETGYYNEPQPE